MFKSPHTICLVNAFVLAVALSALVVPVAQAADKSDAVDRYLRNSPAPLEYGIPRAMPSHFVGAGVTLGQQVGVRRAMPSDYAAAGIDVRPTLVAVPGGFDWRDATYGAGMTAAALLVAGAIAVGIRQRRRVALS